MFTESGFKQKFLKSFIQIPGTHTQILFNNVDVSELLFHMKNTIVVLQKLLKPMREPLQVRWIMSMYEELISATERFSFFHLNTPAVGK